MNKSTFFSGQPIFAQLLKLIPKDSLSRIVRISKSDHYCKRFNTFEHLVTLLYAIFNNCNSLREITTGMLASEQRLSHLGVRYHPRRSTISDANNRRQAEVFGEIYFSIFKKYAHFLSDSRKTGKASRLYMIDSTTIKLFHDILRTGGPVPSSGRCKGGIKVHTVIRSDQDVPSMVRFSSGVTNDSQYLREVNLPKGSVIVFDRGYRDFATFNKLTRDGITCVTRRSHFHAVAEKDSSIEFPGNEQIVYDKQVIIGHRTTRNRVHARHVCYRNPETGEVYEYFTNNLKMCGTAIASLYRKRCK